jgi:hypothetical protein
MAPKPTQRARDRATAFLAQANEDLQAAKQLKTSTSSVIAMLLQMVFEKAIKAARLRQGTLDLGNLHTHKVAAKFLDGIKRQDDVRKAFGVEAQEAWSKVIPIVTELERAHPHLIKDTGPQLEYPWEDPLTDKVGWPARDLTIAKRLADPKSRELADVLKFASSLVTNLDKVFKP